MTAGPTDDPSGAREGGRDDRAQCVPDVLEPQRVVPGRVMTVTVSCDHRIIDGVLAGRFLRELKGLLENPLALVL